MTRIPAIIYWAYERSWVRNAQCPTCKTAAIYLLENGEIHYQCGHYRKVSDL